MNNELADLRAQLDKLDFEMIELLSRRFVVTQKVGALKAREDLPKVDPKREEEMFARIRKLAQEMNVTPQLADDILRLIINEAVNQHLKHS